jgi:anti-sigma28 factor (negative regulator of flagellin synthesis)
LLMGEISTINNRPGAATDVRSAQAERDTSGAILTTTSKEAAQQASEDASQLTKLSSVLNGLKRGASAMRAQVTHAMAAVRSGDYHVDPLQVSRRIVLDSLAWRR